jgi:biopolymer transport protein TolQ
VSLPAFRRAAAGFSGVDAMTIVCLTFPPVAASVISAFWLSNFAGQAIVVILVVGSIFAWTLMLTKLRELRDVQVMSNRFIRAYRGEAHPVSLFMKRQKYEPSPMYRLYDTTCKSIGAELEARGVDPNDLFMGGVGTPKRKLTANQLLSVRSLAESFMDDQILLLETSMHLLALCVSAAPLLGLLGTVWGLLEAFGDLAGAGSIMLSAVAPGISGALLTTVVGLVVAIPSAIAYNIIVDKIRRITVATDNFVQELMSDIERHYVAE